MIKKLLTIAAIAAAFSGTSAQAVNLVVNGDFETTTLSGSSQFSDYFNGNQVAGWTTSGYNFIFFPGTALTTGANTQYGPGLTFWGPGNGSANGYVDSPTGGNYVGADGAYITASIDQTISGLMIGQKYAVGFDWAAAQQYGFNGATTEAWGVTFGGQTISTAIANNADHGFVPWKHEKFVFTATNSTQVLSFLAAGTPAGVPPFSLLDGVTLTAVPEASTWMMLIAGFGMVGYASRRRNRTDVLA